jgi:hypothetical protein
MRFPAGLLLLLLSCVSPPLFAQENYEIQVYGYAVRLPQKGPDVTEKGTSLHDVANCVPNEGA